VVGLQVPLIILSDMGWVRRIVLLWAGAVVLVAVAATGPSSAETKSSNAPYCGRPLAKAGGGLWRCTFSDQFLGTHLARDKWTLMTTANTGVPTPDCRVATPKTIRVSGGTLKLTVRDTGVRFLCRNANGSYVTQYIAGAVSTTRKFSQAFGRFEVRAAMPDVTVPGLHSAIWLWPQRAVYGPLSGEIDINERRTSLPDLAVPTVHYRDDGTAGPKTAWNCRVEHPEHFHTYAVEWTRTRLRFIYDGRVCLTHVWHPAWLAKPRPFDERYFLVLTQNLGRGPNAFRPGVTPLPGTMVVDYVRIWS
jgi:beta-glucanase (GH16 family)